MSFSQRLFVGLDLPLPLQTELATLDPGVPGLRWLPPGQLHLTMSFLGEVPLPAKEKLQAALAGVQVPPFHLPVTGLGTFRSRGNLTVMWAGVGRGHPHLFLLHRRIQDAVIAAGLEPDLKPFKPHITVARSRTECRQSLKPFLRQHEETEFGMLKVEHFTLYSSDLDPAGAVHTPELKVELVAA